MPFANLNDFANLSATHVVSLGGRCATAYNLRRYYNFGEAFPLDWWISSVSGVISILNDPNCDYIYDKDLLTSYEDRSILHIPTGILLHHEFPHDSAYPGKIACDWSDHIEAPKQRTKFLLDKFLNLNRAQNRILFVRELLLGRDDTETQKKLHQLQQKLTERFNLATWTISVLVGPPEDAQFSWKGNPLLWDKLLVPLNVKMVDAKRKIFTENLELILDT